VTADVKGQRVIVALDFGSKERALAIASRLSPKLCRLKVGFELFSAAGPEVVRSLIDSGFDVFLDLKFHDIPNTVAKACRTSAELGVWMLNVHALGGERMMLAAREAIDASSHKPLLIAVTVLTSHGEGELAAVGIDKPVAELGLRLARLAQQSGMDGVVCSAREAADFRAAWPDSVLVTPGIRPEGADAGDQRRITTPKQAIASGSSYLVIGRPITEALDPLAALKHIINSLV